MHKIISSITKLWWFITIFHFISALACSQSIVLDIQITATAYKGDESVWKSSETPVQIILAENGWKMIYDPQNGEHQMACDGNDIYFLSTENGNDVSIGSVMPGIIPMGMYDQSLPWLAYCSTVFSDREFYAFPPWLVPNAQPDAHIFDIKAKFSKQFPKLPIEISWIANKEKAKSATSSKYIYKPHLSESEVRNLRNWKFMVPDGFTAGIYSANNFTSIGSWSVPRTARLEVRRYFGEQDDGRDWRITGLYEISLTDHKTSSENLASVIPEIVQPVYIFDSRLSENDNPPIKYVTTNNWITDTNDSFLVESMSKVRSSNSRSKTIKFLASFGFQAVIIVLVFIPFAMYIKNRTKNRTQINQT